MGVNKPTGTGQCQQYTLGAGVGCRCRVRGVGESWGAGGGPV